jgi:hypothetical protein
MGRPAMRPSQFAHGSVHLVLPTGRRFEDELRMIRYAFGDPAATPRQPDGEKGRANHEKKDTHLVFPIVFEMFIHGFDEARSRRVRPSTRLIVMVLTSPDEPAWVGISTGRR